MTTRFQWVARSQACLSLILLASVLVGTAPVLAADDKMVFRTEAPDPRFVAVLGTAWNIYADGVIDVDAPKRAEQLIEQSNIPPNSIVYLNSPGGNLYAGMELGRVFRKNGFSTDVGKLSGPRKTSAGVCFSACTLTFLGGKFRYLPQEATYGVHRFFLSGGSVAAPDALAIGQVYSAAILQYIREMGADPELLNEMSQAGSEEINVLSESRLQELGVVNNGVGKTVWTVESKGNPTPMLYLKGERDTEFGFNKFILYCDPSGKKVLYVVFDPKGRASEVVTMHAISLFLDDDTIKISDRLTTGPIESNGWINAMFELDQPLLDRLLSAKTVGVAFQYSYEGAGFLGFQGMDFTGGRDQLVGLLSSCKPSGPAPTPPKP